MSGYNHVAEVKKLEGYAAFKKVPYPKVAVFLTGLLLLIGGVGIFFGIYIHLAVACIILFLIPVTFVMHNFWEQKTPEARAQEYIAFTKNVALIGAALAYLFV